MQGALLAPPAALQQVKQAAVRVVLDASKEEGGQGAAETVGRVSGQQQFNLKTTAVAVLLHAPGTKSHCESAAGGIS